MTFKWMLVAGAVLALAGCSHRHYYPYEEPREADLGPIAGGVVGQTIARGPAPPGSADGALRECQADGRCTATPTGRPLFDERAGRYYYGDPRTGRTYWTDGSPRS